MSIQTEANNKFLLNHTGITAIQTGDYKRGLSEMKDCHQPISEAKQLGKTLDLRTIIGECNILEEDILMHQCIAESIQARVIGNVGQKNQLFQFSTNLFEIT